MKKILLISFHFSIFFGNAQVLNTQNALSGQAERHLQFKISDAAKDVLEIGNSTSLNAQFQPTIWAHKESSPGPVLVFSANTVTSMDNGTVPMLNFVAGKDIFDNNAPNTSQFPWGDGGTVQPLINRPIVAFSNAYNNLVLLKANGNFGIGTTNPDAKLHTVGNLKFEGLTTSNSGCPLLLDTFGNVYKSTICQISATEIYDKKPILNALNTIKTFPTYNYSEFSNNTIYKSTADYDAIAALYPNYRNGKNDDTQIIALLIESIKELKVKVDALEEQLGTKNAISDTGIKIYPNPVKNDLTIFFDKEIKSYVRINIYNTEGRKISNYQVRPSSQKVSINVSNLPTGNYLYEIIADGSQDVSKGKFIKE
ncbi:T9SS type A sorting domain-containing protein [Epilithonimonas caeni]|uniref:T9SS type A sorting domain-containing protein n=1 Tax=Epilithonimonas caeni TaxID=365343 RepID=UPI00041A6632|nr:T9SS type A sorting domain-containing protein [Epilithonimonas caeni]